MLGLRYQVSEQSTQLCRHLGQVPCCCPLQLQKGPWPKCPFALAGRSKRALGSSALLCWQGAAKGHLGNMSSERLCTHVKHLFLTFIVIQTAVFCFFGKKVTILLRRTQDSAPIICVCLCFRSYIPRQFTLHWT